VKLARTTATRANTTASHATQCCDAHEKPLPDRLCAHTPRREPSILQTSPNRSQVTTGSDGVPAGLLVDELEPGPQASKSPVTSATRTIART